MKKARKLWLLVPLLLCLVACAKQQEQAGLLWLQSTEALGPVYDFGVHAVGDKVVVNTASGLACFQPRKSEASVACAFPEGASCRLLSGDELYALTAQDEVCPATLEAESIVLGQARRISLQEDAGYLAKGVVSGAWLTALHLDGIGSKDTGSCYVYPLDGGEATCVQQDGVLDLCAYQGGKALLLCRKDASLELRTLDPATGQQALLATLEDTAGAGLAYYAATDSIYLARPGGIWQVDRRGKAVQAGYLSWTQIRWDTCAAITSDGCYALYAGNDLRVYDLHAPAGSVASLTLSGSQLELYCREALNAYQAANPQLNLSLTSGDAITGEAFLQSLSAGNTADILGIEQPELLDAMIQKGYCADLSGSKVIASLVERMDPGLSARFCRDGKIYGVPYYAAFSDLIPGIQPEIAQSLGIPREEWPKDWVSFLDFLEAWADDPRLEAENISLLCVLGPMLNYRDALLRAITEQQLASCALQGVPVTLDTPAFREILARLDEITPLLEQLMARDSALYTGEGEPRRLLILGYQMLTGDGDKTANGGCELLPLAWGENAEMLFPISQGILVVQAGSSQQGEAVRLLEALLTGLELRSRAILMPDARKPVEYANYQSTLAQLEAEEADYRARYDACTDEAERREMQSSWEAYRDSYASSLAMRYELTPASIENLANAQPRMVCPDYSKFYQQKSESIFTLYLRYLRQEIAADQFLQEVERALEMSRLEAL